MDVNKRKFLPTAFLPLDSFGEKMLHELDDVIRLSEPDLMTSGWARVLPLWAADSHLAVLKEIEVLQAVQRSGQQSNFESPYPSFSYVLIFLVGSLSQTQTVLLEGIKSFIEAAAKESLLISPRISICLDVSSFVGEEMQPLEERLGVLSTALSNIHWWINEWGGKVFLFDKNSPSGLIATKREHIQDAMRIFLEAVTLGQYGTQLDWLINKSAGQNPRFSTISLFSMVSPQFDLRKYFASVSFHEVFTTAQATPKTDDVPQKPDWPIISRTIPPTQAIPPLKVIKPGFFQSKKSYMDCVDKAFNNFTVQFSRWRESLPDTLDGAGQELMAAEIYELGEYGGENGKLTQTLDAALNRDQFAWGMETFGTDLEMRAKELIPAIPLNGDLLQERSISDLLESIQQELDKKAERLPNPFSLAMIAAGIAVLQILVTHKLLIYSNLDPQMEQVFFWAILILWVLFGVYFAWRLPAFDMEHVWRDKRQSVIALCNQIKSEFENLTHSLIDHWNAHLKTSVASMDIEMARKIHLAFAYLQRRAIEYRHEFPYEPASATDPISWEKVLFGPHPFKRPLERKDDVQKMLTDLHKSAEYLISSVKDCHTALYQAINAEHVTDVEEVIRRKILEEYGKPVFVHSDNPEDDLEVKISNASVGWNPKQQLPLLPVDVNKNIKSGSFHIVCSPIWHTAIEKQILKRMGTESGIKIIDLVPEDRIYFYRVFDNISTQDIIAQIDKKTP